MHKQHTSTVCTTLSLPVSHTYNVVSCDENDLAQVAKCNKQLYSRHLHGQQLGSANNNVSLCYNTVLAMLYIQELHSKTKTATVQRHTVSLSHLYEPTKTMW